MEEGDIAVAETQLIRVVDMHPRDNARPIDEKNLAELTRLITKEGYRAESPVVLCEFGRAYRVVCGNHRRLACIAAGVAEAPAVIMPPMTEAEMILYDIGSNIQKPASKKDMYECVQMVMTLDDPVVTPEKIWASTGFTPETQVALRRARRVTNDDDVWLSRPLEFSLAIDEFIDDPTASAAIVAAGNDWREEWRRQRILADGGGESIPDGDMPEPTQGVLDAQASMLAYFATDVARRKQTLKVIDKDIEQRVAPFGLSISGYGRTTCLAAAYATLMPWSHEMAKALKADGYEGGSKWATSTRVS